MTLQMKRCSVCGREILALSREEQPVCCHCRPVVKKQGLLALLFSLVR